MPLGFTCRIIIFLARRPCVIKREIAARAARVVHALPRQSGDTTASLPSKFSFPRNDSTAGICRDIALSGRAYTAVASGRAIAPEFPLILFIIDRDMMRRPLFDEGRQDIAARFCLQKIIRTPGDTALIFTTRARRRRRHIHRLGEI